MIYSSSGVIERQANRPDVDMVLLTGIQVDQIARPSSLYFFSQVD
jgi:hypothetical protein